MENAECTQFGVSELVWTMTPVPHPRLTQGKVTSCFR
jgi:hypothetical protein